MPFYDDYADLESQLASGRTRYDELTDLGQVVVEMGRGNLTLDKLTGEGLRQYQENYGDEKPSFLGDWAAELKSGWGSLYQGLSRNPAIDYLSSAIAQRTPFPSSTVSTGTDRVLGEQEAKVSRNQDIIDVAKNTGYSALQIPYGMLTMAGAGSEAAASTAQRELGLPQWTRLPMAIGAGVATGGTGTGILGRTAGKFIPGIAESMRRNPGLVHSLLRFADETKGIQRPAGRAIDDSLLDPQLDLFKGARLLSETPRTFTKGAEPQIDMKLLDEIIPNRDVPHQQLDLFPTRIGEEVRPGKPVVNTQRKTEFEFGGDPDEYGRRLTPGQLKYLDNIVDTFEETGRRHPNNTILFSDPDTGREVIINVKQTERNLLGGSTPREVIPEHSITNPSGENLDLFSRGTNVFSKGLDEVFPLGKPQTSDFDPNFRLFQERWAGENLGDLRKSDQTLLNLISEKPIKSYATENLGKGDFTPATQKLLDNLPGDRISLNPGTLAIDKKIEDAAPGWGRIWNAVNDIDRTRLYVQTTSLGTAIRNAGQAAFRTAAQVPLAFYGEASMGRPIEGLKAAWNEVKSIVDVVPNWSRLKEGGRFNKAFQDAMMLGAYTDDPIKGKVLRGLGAANRFQEQYFFLRGTLAKLQSELGTVGLSFRQVDPHRIPAEVWERAINHGRELTYQLRMKETMGKTGEILEQAANQNPLTGILFRNIAPYARFNLGNALQDIINFSPLGTIRALANTKDTEKAMSIMGKSVAGLHMTQAAARLKADPDGEWYHYRDDDGQLKDARKWHPFDAFLLMGELINRPPGSPGYRLTPKDYISAFSGIDRMEGSYLDIFAGLMQNMSPDKAIRAGAESIGNWLAGWTAPLKTAQSGLQILGGNEQDLLLRDVRQKEYGAFLDPAIRNIPGLSRTLPERVSPLRPDTPKIESPLRSLFGLDSANLSPLEQELLRLKQHGRSKIIDPVTGKESVDPQDLISQAYAGEGSPEANRALNEHMGKIGSKILNLVAESKGYQGSSNEIRRRAMGSLIGDLKGNFREALKLGLNEDQATQWAVERLSKTNKAMIEEFLKE